MSAGTDSALTLRPYRQEDWPCLCAIHDEARRHELQAACLMDAYLTLEQTAQNEGLFDGELVVAELGGRVLGFVAWCQAELTWLYVDPALHRQGLGRALLRHAIAACGGTLDTEVLVGNEAALTLYLSEGFRVQRRADGRLAGNESFAASGWVLRREGAS